MKLDEIFGIIFLTLAVGLHITYFITSDKTAHLQGSIYLLIGIVLLK